MISIVFPAYNEAENLKRFTTEVIPVFDALGEEYEVVIVDDGSADETAVIARNISGPVRLVPHDKNRGLGSAVRTGIDEARGELIVTMDSDLTFAPSLVKDLLARYRQGDVDVVSGSPKMAEYDASVPKWRIMISHTASMIYGVVMGKRFRDVSPIFRLYKKVDVQQLPLQSTGFDINVEILFLLLRNGCRVVEIPAPLTQRLHGESKLNYPREIMRHLRLISRMAKFRLRI